MKTFFVIFWFISMAWLAHGEERSIPEYGTRPENSIYDPQGALSPEVTERLSADLKNLRQRDGVDMVLVILPSIGELPAEHFAKRFADGWGEADLLTSVVLDVTGRNDGPWIYIGGSVTNSDRNDVIPMLTQQALRRVRQEPDRESCLRSALEETSSIIRFLLGKVKTQGEEHQRQEAYKRFMEAHQRERRKILLTGGIVALFPLAGLTGLCVIGFYRRRSRYFPPLVYSKRLGAPYSGGNNAITHLG